MSELRFTDLREGNRLEAKLAKGGLPRSLWETYSAFANTEGGTILLGVEEAADHGLVPVGVSDPQKMLDDLWSAANNPQRVSANVLMDDGARAVDVDGVTIIRMDVPRADRHVRPVFVGGNPLTGTYRRNHSGDYRCSYEQVQAMMRDAADRGQDARVIEEVALDELDQETIRRYRTLYNQSHDRHPWAAIEDEAFLCKIGAAGRGADGAIHPTGAGLLLFGQDWVILREFPHYFLDYRRQTDPSTRWNDRFTSSSGDWSGNVIDFYDRAYNKLKQAFDVPFQMEGIYRVDDTPAHRALREALANCVTNADFYGRQGVVCLWEPDAIRISNPGTFRVDVGAAIAGGITDPRNETIMRILSYVEIGERAGSGLPKIYEGWRESGYAEPRIEQSFEPDRTALVLPLSRREPSESDNKPSELASEVDNEQSKSDGLYGNPGQEPSDLSSQSSKSSPKLSDSSKDLDVSEQGDANSYASERERREAILRYVRDRGQAKRAEISDLLDLSRSRTSELLNALVRDGKLKARGEGRARVFLPNEGVDIDD